MHFSLVVSGLYGVATRDTRWRRLYFYKSRRVRWGGEGMVDLHIGGLEAGLVDEGRERNTLAFEHVIFRRIFGPSVCTVYGPETCNWKFQESLGRAPSRILLTMASATPLCPRSETNSQALATEREPSH